MSTIEEQQAAMLRQAELEALTPITYDQMMAVFHKWMLIPDPYFIKFMLACYCANALSQRPVWAIIIAPSGGGKTEVVNSLLSLPDIYSLSTLTPNTFLSGMPGAKDASLLPKINGKLVVIKDWTVLMSMQRDAQSEVYGQLRDVHDGAMTKAFGNGQVRVWKGKVAILACSTESVDQNQQQHTHLGERFVNYRPLMPDRLAVARIALNNADKQNDMTIELQNAVYAFMKGVNFKQELPALPLEAQEQLINLAEFATKARSGVIRDFGFKKEVLFVPSPEMPTRALQQVALLGQGAMIVNGGALLEDDTKMLYKVMLDSIPKTNLMVIKEMAKGDQQTTAAIASSLGYPTDTIRTYLENQALLKICIREKGDVGQGDRWTLNPRYVDIIRKYNEIRVMSPDEIRENEEARQAEEIAREFAITPEPIETRSPYAESDIIPELL